MRRKPFHIQLNSKEENNVKRTLRIFCCVIVIAAMLLTVACSNQPAASEPTAAVEQSGSETPATTGDVNESGVVKAGDIDLDACENRTLYVVTSDDPSNLDPNDSTAQTHLQVTRQIFETLVYYDNDGNLLPWLAESWEYEDDETLVMHIRQGVMFHDGTELKASDVYFSFKRIIDNKLIGYMEVSGIDIANSEVVDDYTVKFKTFGPQASLIASLENPDTCIISEAAYTAANGDFFNGAAIGTGPYKYVSYSAGDSIVLEAFDNYWNTDAKPYIKHVTMRFITDSSTRATEAESGGSDIVYDINATDLERLMSIDTLNVVTTMGTNTSYLCFNCAIEPFNNEALREAVWYAVEPSVAVSVAYRNFGGLADDFVCPGINGRSANIKDYFVTRDVEKAKQIMTDAGYPDGFSFSICLSSSNQQRIDMAQVFQSQCAEAGITVDIEVLDGSAQDAKLLAGEAQSTIYGLSATTFEAGRPLLHFLADNSESAIWCYYDDTEFNEKLTTALSTIDNDTRFKLYGECEEILMKHFVALPLWYKGLAAACQLDIGGFQLTRSYEQHYLQYVYFIAQ